MQSNAAEKPSAVSKPVQTRYIIVKNNQTIQAPVVTKFRRPQQNDVSSSAPNGSSNDDKADAVSPMSTRSASVAKKAYERHGTEDFLKKFSVNIKPVVKVLTFSFYGVFRFMRFVFVGIH